MRIVLDSNTLIDNFRMTGPIFRLFRWFLHNQPSQLYIPKVVLEEVKNKYREKANDTYRSVLSQIENLNSNLYLDIDDPISQEDLDKNCDEYETGLDEALQSLNADIIPYDDIPHVDIIKRELARIKPFRRTNKKDSVGYRDALIWESILRHVIVESEKVVFITNNKSDFYDLASGGLHSQLSADLLSKGFNPEDFSIYMDIQTFVKEHVKPLLPKVDISDASSLTSYFVEDHEKIESLLLDYFNNNKTKLCDQLGRKLGLPFDLTWSETDMLTIREIEDIEDFSVFEAHEIDDDLIYVEFEFCANFDFEFYAHNFSPDCRSELPNWICLEDYEDDKYGAWLAANVNLPMSGSLSLNIIDKSVEDIEGHFPEIYGICNKCGEPIISDAAESCSSCGYKFF